MWVVVVNPRRLLSTLTMTLILAACGDSGPGGTTNGAHPDCECVVDEDQQGVPPDIPACVELTCPVVRAELCYGCDEGTTGEPETGGGEVDPSALDCALTALRDRSPGLLQWELDIDSGYGFDGGYVLIKEDGRAIVRTWSWLDLGGETQAAVLGELPASSEFDACLALDDEEQRFECLRSTSVSSELVCDGRWDSSSNF